MKSRAFVILLASGVIAASLSAQPSLIVQAGKAYLSPQRTVTHASILLKGGKIAEVASRAGPEAKATFTADQLLDFPDAIITAGLVDIHNQTGSANDLAEPVEAMTPELRAALAYDPWAPGWQEITRRGVTSAVLAPDDRNLAGGLAAFIKPGDPIRADSDTYLKLSVTSAALDRERRPTSLMGAVDYLRASYESLAGARPEALTPAQRIIASTLGGARPVGIACQETREILAALDVIASYRLSAFLLQATRAEQCLDRVKAAQIPVVLAPVGFDAPRHALRLPSLLAAQGITFAFAGETDRESELPALQLSMCLAVRHGVAPDVALAAVTAVPAQIAGLSDRVGTLFAGRDADLCVWSGEPWDLRAKLLLVVRDGRIVHQVEKANGSKN